MSKIIINTEEKSTHSIGKAKTKIEAQKNANVYLWNKALEKKSNQFSSEGMDSEIASNSGIFNETKEQISHHQKNDFKPSSLSPFDLVSKKENTQVNFQTKSSQQKLKEKDLVVHKKERISSHIENPSAIPFNTVENDFAMSDFENNEVPQVPMISATAVKQIEKIISHLAEEISISSLGEKTETTIVIKNSDLFNDSKVTITEFKTAPREINITFENLSQKAHQLILNQANQDLLKSILENKGMQIHIISAMTTVTAINPQSINYNNNYSNNEHRDNDHPFGSSQNKHKDSKDSFYK